MSFISADQILAHAVSDYFLQSHWAATNKTHLSLACAVHVACYVPLFALFKPSITAFLFIAVTHFIIDRWRLARYLVFVKNFIAPRSAWPQWADCSETGFHHSVPDWLAKWLLIIVDNLAHIVLNGIALKYL